MTQNQNPFIQDQNLPSFSEWASNLFSGSLTPSNKTVSTVPAGGAVNGPSLTDWFRDTIGIRDNSFSFNKNTPDTIPYNPNKVVTDELVTPKGPFASFKVPASSQKIPQYDAFGTILGGKFANQPAQVAQVQTITKQDTIPYIPNIRPTPINDGSPVGSAMDGMGLSMRNVAPEAIVENTRALGMTKDNNGNLVIKTSNNGDNDMIIAKDGKVTMNTTTPRTNNIFSQDANGNIVADTRSPRVPNNSFTMRDADPKLLAAMRAVDEANYPEIQGLYD